MDLKRFSGSQPNSYSCLPTCAALMLGVDIREFISDNFPDREAHIQELVDYLERVGIDVISYNLCFRITTSNGRHFEVDHKDRVKHYLDKYSGILIVAKNRPEGGILHHAVLWSHTEKKIYDPGYGRIYELGEWIPVGLLRLVVDSIEYHESNQIITTYQKSLIS